MSFKMKPFPVDLDSTPIYEVDFDENGVMGMANNNGTIIVNKDLPSDLKEETISHEKVHLEQMKRGDLDYDEDFVYWKGKKFARSQMNEGAKSLPWEAEAYKKEKKAR